MPIGGDQDATSIHYEGSETVSCIATDQVPGAAHLLVDSGACGMLLMLIGVAWLLLPLRSICPQGALCRGRPLNSCGIFLSGWSGFLRFRN